MRMGSFRRNEREVRIDGREGKGVWIPIVSRRCVSEAKAKLIRQSLAAGASEDSAVVGQEGQLGAARVKLASRSCLLSKLHNHNRNDSMTVVAKYGFGPGWMIIQLFEYLAQ